MEPVKSGAALSLRRIACACMPKRFNQVLTKTYTSPGGFANEEGSVPATSFGSVVVMRVLIFLVFLAIFGGLGGCARKPDVTYVDLPPNAPPVSSTEREQVSTSTVRRKTQIASRSAMDAEPKRQRSARVVEEPVKKPVEEPIVEFDLVQAKAEQVGVEHLTQTDIEGLSFAEIQRLRGY